MKILQHANMAYLFSLMQVNLLPGIFTREKQLCLDLETSFAIHAVTKYKRYSECVLQVPKALVPIRLDRLHVKETKIM